MPRSTLNLGILAHVDAGKTTLTERLLYAAGLLAAPGRVDDGTTATDTLALERERGITIRSAVVSFDIGEVSVNLLDTPGHPDFIAEVDRVLGVLDGAVLVVSAVEGVQPQTRVLMRTLRRLRVPTLLFVNKIDRRGADPDRTLAAIRRRLGVPVVPLTRVHGAGSRDAIAAPLPDHTFTEAALDVLTGCDDALLAAFVADGEVPAAALRAALRRLSRSGRVHPVLAGSAATGAGIEELRSALVELLPRAGADGDAPLSGSIFTIERDARGEKLGYARIFDGTLRVRDRPAHPDDPVTAIEVVSGGSWTRATAVRAGEIGRLRGLAHSRIGEPLGRPRTAVPRQFPRPGLEAVVEPVRAADGVALRAALAQLAEQDPLIDVRDAPTGPAVSLYGEVQKEVVQATLAAGYGIATVFRPSTPVCIERPVGTGDAVEVLNAPGNPFHAGIGLRVEPAPVGSGIEVRVPVDPGTAPLYVYRSFRAFAAAVERYARETLREGLHGWSVQDCRVTLTASNYSVADGPPSRRGPTSTAADFRKLLPLVLMTALDRAGVAVCEPVSRVRIDAPAETLGPVLAGLARLSAAVEGWSGDADVVIEALLPTADVRHVQRIVPDLTGGDGLVEATPAGYQPVRGAPPARLRTSVDPRHRVEYLAALRGSGR